MSQHSGIYDVIVIGGGASGMMTAGRAAERGKRVLLLEKNNALGEKLKITGGGRCNITNAEENQHILLAQYGDAKKFLFSPFSQFGVRETFSFFEERGLPLVVQEGKRAFPKTESAVDVFRALERYVKEGNVIIQTQSAVRRIIGKNGHIEKVVTEKGEFFASSFILATGGTSHPETGSTGDGLKWLQNLGHTIQTPTPTVVPLAVQEAWVKELSGVTLSGVRITFFGFQKKLALKGNVLCTHFGLSGPLILNAAGKVADMLYNGSVTAAIDLHPTLDHGALDKIITELFNANKNKVLKNVFHELVPNGTTRAILPLLTTIDPEIKVHSVTKVQRKQIMHCLKELPITILGLMGNDRAVIADGGLSIAEVDGKTMRSKLYDNLYVTGDLLHISRPSGGYSLQLCWTTGFVAGSHAE